MPKISIIVPVYNSAKYLNECMDSLLVQTFTDFEVVCINDGSTDNSQQILEDYRKLDARIRIFTQENSGTSTARNYGIAMAMGEYIYPLDSDDKIAPTCLNELYRVISTTDYSVVCCEAALFGQKNGNWILPKVSRWNMYNLRNGIHNSALYAKHDWEKYNGYSTELNRIGGEDFDFWLYFLDDKKKLIRIPQILFYYRIKSEDESRHLQSQRIDYEGIICRHHPKIHQYKILNNILSLPLKILRFFLNIKTKNGTRTLKIFKIPLLQWHITPNECNYNLANCKNNY